MPKLNLKWFFLFFIFPFLLGTDACQENYNFAAQSTVTDDDGPTINFANVSSTIFGESGTSNINITLSQSVEEEVSVPYTLSGTATEDSDYTITATPLKIAAGSTSATITVTVTSDEETEVDETVIITLGTPTGAELGSRDTHTVTITEDDETDAELPELAFELSDAEVEEGEDLEIIVTLSEALDEDAEFAFEVTGTARGIDYDLDDTVAFFEAGEVEAIVTLSALADNLDDDSETVILTLTEDERVELGSDDGFTATIRESGTITADARSVTNPETDLGKEILEGLIALENQQNTKSNSVPNKKDSSSVDCNWIGNKLDPACQEGNLFNDSDQDGYSDELETSLGTDPDNFNSTPPLARSKLSDRFQGIDNDLDGLSNQLEINIGTNPSVADTDSDGIKDGLEDLGGSDPLAVDSKPVDQDRDGIADEYELSIGANPQLFDTDSDGVIDGVEVMLGLDPLKFDTDGDGISDFKELQTGTDPLTPDWLP